MRVVCLYHAYVPSHNAGAETMAHAINLDLVARGHTVEVFVRRGPATTPDGIAVRPRGPAHLMHRLLAGADVAITHLDETRLAMTAAARARVPLVHMLHNDRQLDHHRVATAAGLVANSQWIADSVPRRFAATPRVVVWPPTFPAAYDPSGRDMITLVNPIKAKGADLFYELAARLQPRGFLVVAGGYGAQVPPPPLPNIDTRRNLFDMGPVWRRTRILLAPSSYESFGKAAAEAHAAGIPVIAHPTPGLLENLDDAGIFADRDDPDAWVAAIEALDDPDAYAAAAKAARARAEQAGAIMASQLDDLDKMLHAVARR